MSDDGIDTLVAAGVIGSLLAILVYVLDKTIN